MDSTATRSLEFPPFAVPEPGTVTQIADGLLWTRFRLPFQLNHVNVYLIEDEGGFAILDTGIGIDETRAAWDALLAGPLGGKRITKVLISHCHPDHVGLAGWLAQRFDAPLYMPRAEYLTTLAIQHRAFAANIPFYEAHGLPREVTETVTTRGLGYLRLVGPMPSQFIALADNEALRIGGRDLRVMTGGGHAQEQAFFDIPAENIFLSADQVLSKISPNISVQAMEPEEDPLARYLESLARIGREVGEASLVLPGHHIPFHGLQARIAQLDAHHAERCGMILDACRETPRTATDLVPVLFHRALDPLQMSFAFSEVVAHVNFLRGRGTLAQFADTDRILRLRTV